MNKKRVLLAVRLRFSWGTSQLMATSRLRELTEPAMSPRFMKLLSNTMTQALMLSFDSMKNWEPRRVLQQIFPKTRTCPLG